MFSILITEFPELLRGVLPMENLIKVPRDTSFLHFSILVKAGSYYKKVMTQFEIIYASLCQTSNIIFKNI